MSDLIEQSKKISDLRKKLEQTFYKARPKLRAALRRADDKLKRKEPIDKILIGLESQINSEVQKREQRLKFLPKEIEYPKNLPVSTEKDKIKQLIIDNQVIIVCGTTGSGKTTQLPKIALEAGFGNLGRIGCTQPRRLAATSMAKRVAEEMKCVYGKEVGHHVRFDDNTCDDTTIKFMTDGILLAEAVRDKLLLQYETIIIDEAHERSLNIDFLLGYIKNLLHKRPGLKVIISSATLDAEHFSVFFDNAPVIEVEGRTYSVDDYFLPPEEDEELSSHIVRAARWITDIDNNGDILVFLPGEREIREAADALSDAKFRNTEILPLFARLSIGEQQKVFQTGPRRRIVLATNVAETSLTIPGIHYVIDSGKARISRYNPRTQVQSLLVEQISQASAKQRRGRCGRVTEGVCVYLYDEDTLDASDEYTDPEILRTSLASVILHMKILNLPDIDCFPFISPPESAHIREGYKVLKEIKALDDNLNLTDYGRQIAAFPIDPHLARMICMSYELGCLPEIMIIVAAPTKVFKVINI